MDVPVFSEKISQQLRECVRQCMNNPSLLYNPKLSFIKELIEHYGGTIPKVEANDSSDFQESKFEQHQSEPEVEFESQVKSEPEVKSESESEESDLELDMTGVLEPDVDSPQKMGNLTLQPTEDEIAESQTKRSEAVAAFVEKDYEKTIQFYTEAIMLNPQAALLYAKRGQIFLLLNKPNACIRDCERALELNPDSAAAHKFRGRAYHLLGKFEEAANDLRLACKFDFDEQADEWLRETTPNIVIMANQNYKEQLKRRVFSLEEKIEILNRIKNGEKIYSIANSLNRNRAIISRIKKNENNIRRRIAEREAYLKHVANRNKEERLKRRVISLDEKIEILNRIKNGEKISSVAKSLKKNRCIISRIKKDENGLRKRFAEREAYLSSRNVANKNKEEQLKRRVISLEEKVNILDRIKNGEKISSIAKSLNINRTTITNIKTNESKIRKSAAEGHLNGRNVVYVRDNDLIKIERNLMIWLHNCIKKKIPLSNNIIKQKAFKIYNDFKQMEHFSTVQPNKSFFASDGWLYRFKKRYKLHRIKMQ